jgi:hypothetical protein
LNWTVMLFAEITIDNSINIHKNRYNYQIFFLESSKMVLNMPQLYCTAIYYKK